MTPGHRTHRAHNSKVVPRRGLAALGALVAGLPALSAGPLGCGGASLARPERTQVVVDDYIPVPYAPRPPPVEIVPASPRKDAVWVDGTWDWSNDRYRWTPGSWVLAPAGAKRASWVVVRRDDGQLFFAPSSWKDATGAAVPEPQALVRARSRATDE